MDFPLIKEPSLEVLLSIVKQKQPKRILEIGTCIGFSGTNMLKVCDAELVTIEIDAERAKIAEDNFKKAGVFGRVTQIVGDATEILEKRQVSGTFDLIFIDGPKGQYLRQFEPCLNLLKTGGILFADNVLFRGYVYGNAEVPRRFKTISYRLKMFIDACKTHSELKNVQIQNVGDGILVAEKI